MREQKNDGRAWYVFYMFLVIEGVLHTDRELHTLSQQTRHLKKIILV